MAIELIPRVAIQPVRSQTGGVDARVTPMQDRSASSMLAVGEGMQDLGRAVTVLADRHQDNVDLATSQRMRNLFDEEHEKELRDPKTGFLTTLGMDASEDRWKQSAERLRSQRQKIEKMAQNDAQRMNFAEFADRRESETNTTANIHQIREGRTFRAGETKAAIERGIDRTVRLTTAAANAAAQAQDPKPVDPTGAGAVAARALAVAMKEESEVSAAEVLRNIDTHADLLGIPKDAPQRARMKQDAADGLHSGVVNSFLADQNTPMANVYFRQHKGEMSAEAEASTQAVLNRANNVAMNAGRDAAAWQVAQKLSSSGASLPTQRAQLDALVRQKGMPVEVAMKTWDMLKDLDTQSYQQLQRDRAEAKQALEQAFTRNPDLSVAGLPAEEMQRINDLGMLGDAAEVHRKVKANRVADALATGSIDRLVLGRDADTMDDLRRTMQYLQERMPIGKEAQTPQGIEKKKRIDERIAGIEEMLDALLTRPRSFVTEDDLPPPVPPEGSPGSKAPPLDIQKFADDIKKALYPGSGR